jgi:hypothetical protein
VNEGLGTWREAAETANPEPLLVRPGETTQAAALPYRIVYLHRWRAGRPVEIEVVGWRQDMRKDPEEPSGAIDEVIHGDLRKGEIWLDLDEW